MFDYLDIVKLKRDYQNLHKKPNEVDFLPRGSQGTIVMVYDERVGSECYPTEYEVEFMNDEGETLAVVTLKGDDLVLVQAYGSIAAA